MIKLINDNCHAIGAEYKNNFKYAQKYSDFVVHSYHAVKNMTTGEGGAVFTNNDKFAEKIKKLVRDERNQFKPLYHNGFDII